MGKLSKCVCRSLLGLAMLFCQTGLIAPAMEYGYAPVSGQVTSSFGWRTDPLTGGSRFHGGLDIAAPTGTPVYAPQAGYVMFSGKYGGFGNVVVLNHGNSLFTVYGHNSQLLVRAGESVGRGQTISLVGSTGRSTGPHLHFEVHYNQQYMNPVTYLAYLQQSGVILAQAKPSSSVYSSSIAAASGAKPVKPTIKNRYSNRAYGSKAVQLVNGSDVETIEF